MQLATHIVRIYWSRKGKPRGILGVVEQIGAEKSSRVFYRGVAAWYAMIEELEIVLSGCVAVLSGGCDNRRLLRLAQASDFLSAKGKRKAGNGNTRFS